MEVCGVSLHTDDGDGLVGRTREFGVVRAVVLAATEGVSGTLLVSGDAGVGKSALARQAALSIGPGRLVLISGSCLPMQSINVPLHPLRLALRASVAPGAEELLRQLDIADHAPRALDAWVDRISAHTPVVILLDDLQWADQSTLDVLTYLAAGPPDRALAVLATVRRETLPAQHRLQRWLADVLRLPRVAQLALDGLDRAGTEAQLTNLLRSTPHQSLVDDVFATTEGNPYWNRLLVHGLARDARRLPSDLPTDLVTAVRRVWSGLSQPARELSSLLAIGGRPISAESLQQVAAALGWGDILPALRESVRERVVSLGESDRYWFDHPLTAQVLEADVTTVERRRWHAAYAQVEEAALAAGRELTLDRAIAVADHHDAAGHRSDAYRWALRSWEVAGSAQGSPELLRLLQRALRLRVDGVDALESLRQLRHWLWRAAQDVGADVEELAALDELLADADPAVEPLLISSLLVRRMLLRYTLGAGFAETDDVRRAAELSSAAPASWQYAQALAEVAHTGLWAGDSAAPEQAERSLRIARLSGNPRALCFALAVNAMREIFAGEREAAIAYARQSLEQAVQAQEWLGYVTAAMWERYALSRSIGEDPAVWMRRRRITLAELGAPHTYVARLSAAEAEAALWSGDWRSCQDRLRVPLGSDSGPFADVIARLAAARLAAWQGRLDEATAHLERADELVDEPGRFLNFPFVTVRTEVLLATGRAAEAYDTAIAGLSGASPLPDLSEWLVPLAARALAESAQSARDNGRADAEILVALTHLEVRYPAVLADSWDPQPSPQMAALTSWYRAEVARARRDPAAAEFWQATVAEAAASRAPWLQAYAGWRGSEALLAGGRAQRAEGRRLLRATYALADRLQARPVLAELTELLRAARIELARPELETDLVSLPGLTAREREILAHVVRGSTYAEIAASLVISEKTVSSHVSNLLRKTGTATRVELSRLATRVGRTATDPGA